MKAKVAVGVALVLALAFTGFVHRKIEPRTRADQGEAFIPKPATARLVALGFNAVVADFYWLQAIQAVGGNTVVDERVGRQLGKLIDVVTTLDPWVDHPYRFAAIWMVEGEENVRTAIRLLHRGIEHHPDDWRNWFYLGFAHFYLLGENEEAAVALTEASGLPGSPAYLPRLVARLRSASADIDVATVFLRQMIDSTDDEDRKAVYHAALDEIEVEQKARFLDRARAAYVKLAGRDIDRVEELTEGSTRVIEKLPRPYPDALPHTAALDAEWVIGEDGRIFSTYYGARYEVHYSAPGGEIVTRDAEQPAPGKHSSQIEVNAEPASPDRVDSMSDEGAGDV